MIPQPLIKYFFLVVISSQLVAQTIESIEVDGNNEFSKSEIIQWSGLAIGQTFNNYNPDSLKKNVLLALANNGFFHSTVEIKSSSLDSTKTNLKISLKEGSPTYVGSIIVFGPDTSTTEYLKNEFGFLEDEVFNKFLLESTISTALDYFENAGNPFARIVVESMYFYFDEDSTSTIDIYLKIESEKKSTIDEIKITGNDKTKDYVIKRNIRLSIGEEYSQDKVDEIPKLLNRLRFFEPVQKPVYYFNSRDKGILEVAVVEKETNSFDGIVGYVPASSGSSDGFFTGFVNIRLRNLFGTERAVMFQWEKEDRESQQLEIRYLEPWLFGYPFNVELGLNQRKQDTTFVQRRYEGKIEFLATKDISASFLISSESTIPTDPDKRGFTVFYSTSLITGASLKFDTRDDLYAPTEGFLFTNTYTFSRKKINGPEQFITPVTRTSIDLQRFEMSFEYFYELFARQVIAAGIHGKELRGDLIETSDLYRLGGTNTLRGYRENQFLGNRIFWSNLEYRYLLTPRSYAFIFFDTGYYLRNENRDNLIPKLESYKTGYGLGLSIETGLGIIGVSFALGQGDSFSEGKIHFGLLNEF